MTIERAVHRDRFALRGNGQRDIDRQRESKTHMGLTFVGELGVRRGEASSEGEHADASNTRRTQAARHIRMTHVDP